MSTVEEIRKRREALRSRDKHLDYEVPGYDGDLVIRFNPASYAAVVAYRDTVDAAGEMKCDADAIVNACREILVKDDGGKLQPIVPGQTTTFADADEAFGMSTETAIDAVFEVFPSDLKVGECAAQLVGWSRSIDDEVDEQLVGESAPGRKSSEPGEQPASA